jgi:tRNA A-37 threonylcarbamoyl transferase component Bud32
LIGKCVKLLPEFAQSWAKNAFPEWFLPDHVVLKMEKPGEEKEIMEEMFDTEVKVYERLNPLQGVVVPRCYGCLRYNGSRALILQHLGGVSLVSPEAATLRLDELADLLQPCYQALHAFGVHYDDPQLANFQVVDAKIMVLDFEQVMLDRSADDNAFFTMTGIRHLAQLYREMQVWYRHEGLLEAA